jgi:hypothetical protein
MRHHRRRHHHQMKHRPRHPRADATVPPPARAILHREQDKRHTHQPGRKSRQPETGHAEHYHHEQPDAPAAGGVITGKEWD